MSKTKTIKDAKMQNSGATPSNGSTVSHSNTNPTKAEDAENIKKALSEAGAEVEIK